MAVLVIAFAALLGAAFGSFAGVVSSRGLSQSLGGRSHCDSCSRTLAWYELMPLISFPVLRAKCRTCGAQIGWTTYLWEVGGATIAVAIGLTVLLTTGLAGG